MALPTLSPDWFTFVPSEQIFDSHKTGRWMRFIFSDYTSCQPSVSILSRYLSSLLPTVFTLSPSCPPLTAKGIIWVEGAGGGICETAAYLPLSHPLHPLHWLSVLSVRAPTAPPIPLSHPYVAWRAVLVHGSSIPLRWREMERDGGRKRKLFNASTGYRSSKRAGERQCYCRCLFFQRGHSRKSHQISYWKKIIMGVSLLFNIAAGLFWQLRQTTSG